MFQLSSVKNEKTLLGNLSLNEYGKMVVCRCCPKIFGVKLIKISEDCSKGKLLKKIFLGNSSAEVSTCNVIILYLLKSFFCLMLNEFEYTILDLFYFTEIKYV